MNTPSLEELGTVARDRHTSEPRDRIDLRADPEWVARVEAAARRFGLNVSAYIRMAVTERLERDEATPPAARRKRPPPTSDQAD